MPEFLTLLPPDEALQTLLNVLEPEPEPEWIEASQSLGRVTHLDIFAPHELPTFFRSTVDGYAVRAEDTFGASDSLPSYLTVTAEILMGTQPAFTLQPGKCALIHTGGMLPEGANAVSMIEYTQTVSKEEIEVLRAVAEGENTIKPGEDVKKGDIVIPAGSLIRPQEIGGLAAFGINHLSVNRKPKVGILSSGDEIVAPDKEIQPGQVRDINTYILQALVSNAGAIAVPYGILPDNLDILYQTALKALRECDLVVFTAGSSASTRDLTAEAINRLGRPGVLVHGVNVRPGKPTILAACKTEEGSPAKVVIGLPGNPVSALIIARLFVIPVIRKYLKLDPHPLQPSISAELSTNLPSQAGREDWVPVHLEQTSNGITAVPVFGKSNLIFTFSRADGLIRIPPDATGIFAGSVVQVIML
jgi:molybdopterin molybdotransferase